MGEWTKAAFSRRHIRFSWALVVTAANVSDTEAGSQLADRLHGKVPRLQKIAADHGYRTTFIDYVENTYGWQVEIRLWARIG